jgi:hypothetical protein
MSTIPRNMSMKTIRVEKDKLLETLRTNKEVHAAEYNEASEGYRDKLLEEYQIFLTRVSNIIKQIGDTTIDLKNVQLRFNSPILNVPENHTSDYTTAIEMLEWSIDEYVDLTQNEFEEFVQDRWDWKENFTAANMAYMKAK